MIAFFIFCGSFVLFGLIIWLVEWTVHRSMTKDHTTKWDYGTFAQFKKEFEARSWEEKYRRGSLFDYSTDSEWHANIIQFNKVGMVLGLIAWTRARIYIRNYIKNYIGSNNRRTFKWSKNLSKR